MYLLRLSRFDWRGRAKIVGEFILEASVLIAVLDPLEIVIQYKTITILQILRAEGWAALGLLLGMHLVVWSGEGRRS
jgi:hypothetical protein